MYLVLLYHGAKPHICIPDKQPALRFSTASTNRGSHNGADRGGKQRGSRCMSALNGASQRCLSTVQCQSPVLITSAHDQRQTPWRDTRWSGRGSENVGPCMDGMGLRPLFRLGGDSQSVSNSDYSISIVGIGEKYLKPKVVGATTKRNQYSIPAEAVYQLCGFRCV